MGERILSSTGSKHASGDIADTRIRYAFQLCLARDPNDREAAVLRRLYESVLTAKAKTGKKATTAEQNACMAVARTMLNLDEFLTRE